MFAYMTETPKKVTENHQHGHLGQVLQRRPPTAGELKSGNLLTHGTTVENFYTDIIHKTGPQDVPNGPAWFAIKELSGDYLLFSIHVAAMKTYYTSAKKDNMKKGNTEKMTVHKYHPKTDLKVAQWEDWPGAAEHLAINKGLYKPIGPLTLPAPDTLEKREEKILEDLRKDAPTERLHLNSVKAACELKPLIQTSYPHGYVIKHDLVRKEPEAVLYQDGLNELNRVSKPEYSMKLTGTNQYEVDGEGKKYTYSNTGRGPGMLTPK